MRRLLGWAIIVLFFGMLFSLLALMHGFWYTVMIFSLSVGVVGLVVLAAWLICGS